MLEQLIQHMKQHETLSCFTIRKTIHGCDPLDLAATIMYICELSFKHVELLIWYIRNYTIQLSKKHVWRFDSHASNIF